jgi:hypothetical protein
LTASTMNDCGAKSKLPAPLIYLSKTGNYSFNIGQSCLTMKEKNRMKKLVSIAAFSQIKEKGCEAFHR